MNHGLDLEILQLSNPKSGKFLAQDLAHFLAQEGRGNKKRFQ